MKDRSLIIRNSDQGLSRRHTLNVKSPTRSDQHSLHVKNQKSSAPRVLGARLPATPPSVQFTVRKHRPGRRASPSSGKGRWRMAAAQQQPLARSLHRPRDPAPQTGRGDRGGAGRNRRPRLRLPRGRAASELHSLQQVRVGGRTDSTSQLPECSSRVQWSEHLI